jgi:hypothetical protein
MVWCAYRNKRGSLNIGRRMEQAIAPLATMYSRNHSSNPDDIFQSDFMPNEDEPELTWQEAMERSQS